MRPYWFGAVALVVVLLFAGLGYADATRLHWVAEDAPATATMTRDSEFCKRAIERDQAGTRAEALYGSKARGDPALFRTDETQREIYAEYRKAWYLSVPLPPPTDSDAARLSELLETLSAKEEAFLSAESLYLGLTASGSAATTAQRVDAREKAEAIRLEGNAVVRSSNQYLEKVCGYWQPTPTPTPK